MTQQQGVADVRAGGPSPEDMLLYSTKGWGPHVWRALHLVALGYPERPSEADRAAYRAYFEDLHKVLPCGACATNYQRHLRQLPLTPDLFAGGPGEPLFAWTVRMHNLVNAELGSANGSDWTPARAKAALARASPYWNARLAASPHAAAAPPSNQAITLMIAAVLLAVAAALALAFFLAARSRTSL